MMSLPVPELCKCCYPFKEHHSLLAKSTSSNKQCKLNTVYISLLLVLCLRAIAAVSGLSQGLALGAKTTVHQQGIPLMWHDALTLKEQ